MLRTPAFDNDEEKGRKGRLLALATFQRQTSGHSLTQIVKREANFD